MWKSIIKIRVLMKIDQVVDLCTNSWTFLWEWTSLHLKKIFQPSYFYFNIYPCSTESWKCYTFKNLIRCCPSPLFSISIRPSSSSNSILENTGFRVDQNFTILCQQNFNLSKILNIIIFLPWKEHSRA